MGLSRATGSLNLMRLRCRANKLYVRCSGATLRCPGCCRRAVQAHAGKLTPWHRRGGQIYTCQRTVGPHVHRELLQECELLLAQQPSGPRQRRLAWAAHRQAIPRGVHGLGEARAGGRQARARARAAAALNDAHQQRGVQRGECIRASLCRSRVALLCAGYKLRG